jgi:glucose-6-phosphate 1-dehydrogenase
MARDKFHQQVKTALINEGWNITDDPLYLKIGRIPIQIDLGAEKLIGAEKNGEKIAVEIKTFGQISFITALYEAIGKYIVYREVLKIKESNRILYLAIPTDIYKEFGKETVVENIFTGYQFKLMLYEPLTEKITSWIEK